MNTTDVRRLAERVGLLLEVDPPASRRSLVNACRDVRNLDRWFRVSSRGFKRMDRAELARMLSRWVRDMVHLIALIPAYTRNTRVICVDDTGAAIVVGRVVRVDKNLDGWRYTIADRRGDLFPLVPGRYLRVDNATNRKAAGIRAA